MTLLLHPHFYPITKTNSLTTHFTDMNQPVLLKTDVNKRAEVSHVTDATFQLRADSKGFCAEDVGFEDGSGKLVSVVGVGSL